MGAATPGHSLPTYSSMADSVHNWQFVHSATSMIMFHFFIGHSLPGAHPSRRGLRPLLKMRSFFTCTPHPEEHRVAMRLEGWAMGSITSPARAALPAACA